MRGLHRAAFAALLGIACVLAPAARANEPIDEPVIQAPEGVTATQVLRAVRAALVKRTWKVGKEKAGYLTAKLVRERAYWCRIGVEYDYRHVAIRYLDSEGLDYDPDEHSIDRGYNKWMRFLVKDIGTNLELMAGLPDAPERRPPVAAAEAPVAVVPVVPAAQSVALAPSTPAAPAAPTRLNAGAELHAQARAASAVVATNPAEADVVAKGPVKNADGTWWYVSAGTLSGWVLQTDLR